MKQKYIFWGIPCFSMHTNGYCQFGSSAFTKSSFYIWKLLEAPQSTKYNNLKNDFDTYLQPYSDFANFRCVHVCKHLVLRKFIYILVHMTTTLTAYANNSITKLLLLLFYNHTHSLLSGLSLGGSDSKRL